MIFILLLSKLRTLSSNVVFASEGKGVLFIEVFSFQGCPCGGVPQHHYINGPGAVSGPCSYMLSLSHTGQLKL